MQAFTMTLHGPTHMPTRPCTATPPACLINPRQSCQPCTSQPVRITANQARHNRLAGHAAGRHRLAAPVAAAAPVSTPPQAAASEEEHEVDTGLEELSQARHIITVDDFAPELVGKLRGLFDERFADPRRIHEQRFMWDYWWCPDAEGNVQYNLVRTQAQVYFGPELHDQLVDALLAYGEANLGCRAITPIWVSYYTDGMLQEYHSDDPHGPFAFVLSLTNWEGREFTGGETAILKPSTVSLWHRPDSGRGQEFRDLVTLVPPLFGRLTVFDPRFPHAVREVRGTRDPRKGRLVLHGWFTDPSPFFTGGLEPEQCTAALNEAIGGAMESLAEGADNEEDGPTAGSHPCTGVLAVRVHVDGRTGEVKDVSFLADTLVPMPSVGVDPAAVRAEVQHELHAWLMDAQFPAAQDGTDTQITIPVVFE